MRILTAEGSRQFTAERLGAEVGISGGTIFRHFASMDEILDAIVDRIEEIIFEDFPPQADDPLEALRQFFIARLDVIASQPEISRLLLTNTLIQNTDAEYRRERLKKLKRRSLRFVRGRLREASKRGLLADDVNPEEGTILVLGCIYSMGHMGKRIGTASAASELAHRTWRIVEKALRKH